MIRTSALIVVVALLGTAMVPDAAMVRKKKSHLGVFGTINGKAFKATNLLGAGDYCVNGIYRPGDGIVTFAAIECRAKRRRQGTAVKKNYKVLAMACTNFDQNRDPNILPLDIPCPASVYEEDKTGRFGLPVSMTQWGASIDYSDPTNPTSNVRMRIDAFDGTNVRGAIFGVFDQSIQGPASTTPAPISGEVQFNFPFKIQ
ncbi:MAG: hypothetical protein ACREQL_09610 [Candidatus Binatia bacterium]